VTISYNSVWTETANCEEQIENTEIWEEEEDVTISYNSVWTETANCEEQIENTENKK